jgi:Sec-independent protein translocase protein TatA
MGGEKGMSADWVIVVIVAVGAIVMRRLDRIGRQLEAVCVSIRRDVAKTESERDEIMQEWLENKKQAAKEERQAWIFWGVVWAAYGAWRFLSH